MRDQCWSKRRELSPAYPVRSAFFIRIRDRRGKHVAAVATARKLASSFAHAEQGRGLRLEPPALCQWKLQTLELKAGHPSRRGGRQKGSAAAYSNKSVRAREREAIGNARKNTAASSRLETAIAEGVSGATNEVRRS